MCRKLIRIVSYCLINLSCLYTIKHRNIRISNYWYATYYYNLVFHFVPISTPFETYYYMSAIQVCDTRM